MTDTARLAEISRKARGRSDWMSAEYDVLWLLDIIAERDAEIARLREPVRITIAGQDWAISHGDSKRER